MPDICHGRVFINQAATCKSIIIAVKIYVAIDVSEKFDSFFVFLIFNITLILVFDDDIF